MPRMAAAIGGAAAAPPPAHVKKHDERVKHGGQSEQGLPMRHAQKQGEEDSLHRMGTSRRLVGPQMQARWGSERLGWN